MLGVKVEGGTGGGRRIVKPKPLWACRCTEHVRVEWGDAYRARIHPGHDYSCADCGARRPS